MRGRISVGTASWSDPEFVRDWYPPKMPAHERLRFYADRFEMVEINSTFYAIPSERQVAQWAVATPVDFVFNVKLHKILSRHSCTARMLPPDLRGARGDLDRKVALTPELEREVALRFIAATRPFSDAGKLGAFLLQLSPSFSLRENALAELESLLGLFSSGSVAVELRNRVWLAGTQLAATRDFFSQRAVTLVSVDAPPSEHFTVMPSLDEITNPPLSYLRLHGRNEKAYLTGRTVAERFDYDYSDAELGEVATRVEKLARETENIHVVFNNNRSDYAPRAAERFRRMVS